MKIEIDNKKVVLCNKHQDIVEFNPNIDYIKFNSCEDIGFEHAWGYFDDNNRICRNCEKEENMFWLEKRG